MDCHLSKSLVFSRILESLKSRRFRPTIPLIRSFEEPVMSFDQSYESFKSEEGALPDHCSKERRPWVAPVLTVERVEQTATTFGPAIFDGAFTS